MKRALYVVSLAALMLGMLLTSNKATASSTKSASHAAITVQLCTSMPHGVPPLKDVSQGVYNAVNMAMYKWRPLLNKVGVRLGPQITLDDAKADGSTYDPNVEAANGLKCINNKNTLGYVGALNSGASVRSEPELNKAFMVQISPSNTNPGLTSVKPYQGFGGRAAVQPATFSGKIKWVTYYRTVTTDALQGPAGAVFAKSRLGAKSVYVVDDSLPYGVGLASAFQAQAQKFGISIKGHGEVPGQPDATKQKEIATAAIKANADMVYCGCDTETTIVLARQLRLGGYTKPYMGGDIFDSAAYLTSIEQGANAAATNNMYATNPGPPPSGTSKAYRTLYKKLYPSFYKNPGPGPYDAPAYDAAGIILSGILKAAKAHQLKAGATTANRRAVVRQVRFIKYCGATGCMKFDANGDTSNFLISVFKTLKGNWAYYATVRAPAGLKPAP